jgi:hypothetical protein
VFHRILLLQRDLLLVREASARRIGHRAAARLGDERGEEDRDERQRDAVVDVDAP